MLDLALRASDVVLLVLLAGLVAQSPRRDHTPWIGAALALSVASFVATSARGVSTLLGPAIVPLTAVCVAKPALLWLFARGLFADAFRIGRRDAAVLAAVVAAGLWHELVFVRRDASALELAGSLAFKAATLALVTAATLGVLRGRASDLDEHRRRWRVRFVVGASLYLAAVVAVQTTTLVLGIATPAPLVTANLAFVLAGAGAAILTLVQLRPVSWLDAPASRARADDLAPAEQRLLDRLHHAFEIEGAWREEGLTITRLADRLGVAETALRRAVNQGLGFRNFNDFLHDRRVREACVRLRAEPEAPVTSIALQAGYGSLGPFNRAFKERVGVTPTAYRRSADSGIGEPARANRPAFPRPTP